MYIQTREELERGLGFLPPIPKRQDEWQKPILPPPPLQETFTSSVITYKDTRGLCRSTECSIYVPSVLLNQPQVDVLVFFHGLDTCKPKHNFKPSLVAKHFQLNHRVENATRKAVLAVPAVLWNQEDRNSGIIRAAWSAAYLNAFVEEVLDHIGKASNVDRKLGRLILSGHSAAYDILTPLAEQFECGVTETKKGALGSLAKVLAMDTTYNLRSAKALELWALNRSLAQFFLVLGNSLDPREPPAIWQLWTNTRGKGKLPENLTVLKTKDEHCALPSTYVGSLL